LNIITRDISSLTEQEWTQYIEQSHRLIAAKLPGKIKKELGL
jgi:predicted DNA-binding protein (MmcQ/YjbR family)